MNERTSLGKLITLSNAKEKTWKPKGGFRSERRLESTLQEVAYLQDEGKKGLARQESARYMIASSKYPVHGNSITSLSSA